MPIFNIPTIIIAPLDWGFGHTIRIIPIIQALQKKSCTIIVAGNDKQIALLKGHNLNVEFIYLKGYDIGYSKQKFWLPFKILLQIPKIFLSIRNEKRWLNKIVDSKKIDLVISDNRYGFVSKKVKSIFITHQLTIKAPFVWLENLLQLINYSFINKFSTCWVPDVEGSGNVAGDLSHPLSMPKIPTKYIGILSRYGKKEQSSFDYNYCVLLSGPEPQRTLLESLLIKQFISLPNKKILFVRGLLQDNKFPLNDIPNHITIKNYLVDIDLYKAKQSSETIICRSGYTSIMELLSMKKKTILIPTPGQTEQYYLGKHLMQQGMAFCVSQDNLDIITTIKQAENFNYALPNINNKELGLAIDNLYLELNM